MGTIFCFGEEIDGYDVRVLNEREVRASAGILFFCAIIAFMNAWLVGHFEWTRVFVVAFLIDFSIRVFVNPKYSPSMVLAGFIVRNQAPEYVGATQKRFAWSIGLALSVAMLWLVVINRVIGPINLLICATCLLLLFFESAFGICIACKVYNLFHREKAGLCPGGACEVDARHKSQRTGTVQMLVLLSFVFAMTYVARFFVVGAAEAAPATPAAGPSHEPAGSDDCTVPDWAKSMGHAEQWKLHHNCM